MTRPPTHNHDLTAYDLPRRSQSRWSDVEKHLQRNQFSKRIHGMMHDDHDSLFSIQALDAKTIVHVTRCIFCVNPFPMRVKTSVELTNLETADETAES